MTQTDKEHVKVAYFTMEIGLDSTIPTYSGGLGVLAGDTIKSCADLGVPIVAVTLLSEKGYFFQNLDTEGNQTEFPVIWAKEKALKLFPETVTVQIEKRTVQIRVWEYQVKGVKGHIVPVYYLDTNMDTNHDYDRTLTSFLYGGDSKYRLCQEIILGIGGLRMIEKLGYTKIEKFHMNEGHSALLTLELLEKNKKSGEQDIDKQFNLDTVRNKCIFTTHTPVPAGHDKFSGDLVQNVLNTSLPSQILSQFCQGNEFNMTLLALKMSKYINGVAKKHGEVSRDMFPGYDIDSITNGIHLATWASTPFKELFDKYIPEWSYDSFLLRHALIIPPDQIWQAHQESKKELINYVNSYANIDMDTDTFTIGFARRAAPYKRADLLFSDIKKLIDIHQNVGKIQIIYAGKAHPKDQPGKDLIKRIFHQMKQELSSQIKVIYLQNYDMTLGKLLTSGADIWLNNPLRPLEASGTSGMKASLNGVPNFSVLDGWWLEGHIENVTGWSIGQKEMGESFNNNESDARDLYHKLENIIIPMYYKNREQWVDIMTHTISLNASYFNTHRMVQEYVLNAYFKGSRTTLG